MRLAILAPGLFIDRSGRLALVESRAGHNPARWFGTAGDGDPACWESDGIMEGSLPSDIDLVEWLDDWTETPSTSEGQGRPAARSGDSREDIAPAEAGAESENA